MIRAPFFFWGASPPGSRSALAHPPVFWRACASANIASIAWLTLLGACDVAPEEPGVAAEELCAVLVSIVCSADAACCGSPSPDCAEVQGRDCRASIQLLLDDARLAYDPARGGALVASLRERGEGCWQDPADYDALLGAFAGTGAEGADCTPARLDAGTLRSSALSCRRGLACRLQLDASGRAHGVCEARDDDACSHALDCGPGRFCDLPAGWTPGLWGTCRPLRAQGWACAGDLECESRHCDGTCRAAPLSARCLSTPYDALVLESAPLAYLRFDETSGARASDAAGDHDGVLTSSVIRETESPIGSATTERDPDGGVGPAPAGGSLRFATDDAAVRVPSIAELTGAAASFELWVRLDGAEAVGPLLELSGAVERGPHVWAFDRGDELYANFVDGEGGDHVIETVEGTLSAGEWHHVAATFDGESGRLYLDGRRVGQTPVASLRMGGDLYVGHRPTGEAPISIRGAIDEVAVYDRALEPSELARRYTAGLAGAHTPRFPLFRWLRP